MRTATIALPAALTALLLIASAAHAQVDDFSIDVGSVPDYLSPDGGTDVNVTVNVACGLILQNSGATTVDLGLSGGDGYVTSDGGSVELSADACVGSTSGVISEEGTITIDPVDGAMGLEAFDLTFDGSYGSATDSELVEGVALDYMDGHSIQPAGDQTFDVTGDSHSFDLDLDITANAKTMVMFVQISASAGSVSGFSSTVYDVPNGVREDNFNVTWTAPAGEWTEETVTFYNYSHCLDKDPCPETNAQDITWTFVNAGGSEPAGNETDDGDKDSPGLPLVGAVAAIGLIAVLRRR